MRVPTVILLGSVFLGVRTNGRLRMAGTGFLLSIPSETNSAISHGYLVTARHCVESAKLEGPLLLRLNRWLGHGRAADMPADEMVKFIGRAEEIELESGWIYHDDETNDVAVLPMAPPPEFAFLVVERANMATADVVDREAIGVGDDLAVVGLFTERVGQDVNRPIVRLGTIAAMPDEPIEDPASGNPFDAYLAEIRSIGGLSGSPVWAMINPGRTAGGSIERSRQVFYLLGLIRGHWEQRGTMSLEAEAETLNMGIATVTPIQKALDIIDSDEMARLRRRYERES
jgi:hypothetical protein